MLLFLKDALTQPTTQSLMDRTSLRGFVAVKPILLESVASSSSHVTCLRSLEVALKTQTLLLFETIQCLTRLSHHGMQGYAHLELIQPWKGEFEWVVELNDLFVVSLWLHPVSEAGIRAEALPSRLNVFFCLRHLIITITITHPHASNHRYPKPMNT
jgi:hypothetical protein